MSVCSACHNIKCSNGSSCLLVPLQAFWNKMCVVPAGDPSHTGSAEGAGLCVSPALLCLHYVQPAAGHRGRVLPHGGWEAGVQSGL